MASTTPSVIDLGGFGVVLSPALQNEPPYDNDPRSYITKIFYHKKDYDDILKKRKRLSAILGVNEEGYQFQTYEREWRGRNFPKRALRLITNQLSVNQPDNEDVNVTNEIFYPIRMLHLGKSLGDVPVNELRSCDVKSILAAIMKVYQTLRQLARHHSIHGDVHRGNVLVYLAPPFCDMSVIDYDRFQSYDEMKKSYKEGRTDMYGAPESYYLIQPHLRSYEEKENDPIKAYVSRFHRNEYVQTIYPTIQEFEQRVRQAIQSHGDKPIPFHHMDSFLMSAILLDLLYRTYPFLKGNLNASSEETAIRKAKDILEQGFNLQSLHRLGPEEIVKQLQQVIHRLEPSLLEQPKNQTDRNGNRTRNNNRNRNKNRNKNRNTTRNRNKNRNTTRNRNKNRNTTRNRNKTVKKNNGCVISGGTRMRR